MSLDTMQPFEQSFTVSQQDPNCLFSTGDNNNYLLETFNQYPQGDFRPTFYNPFEIKHRRRTSRAQLKVLEKSFSENPKPNATIRRILAQRLDMTPRGVQIWFQNRRAKAKLQRRKSFAQSQLDERGGDQHDYPKMESLHHGESDLNQSSVLFSQFFANVQDKEGNTNNSNNGGKGMLSTFSPSHDTMNQPLSGHHWSSWQKQGNISDNARSVAPLAAMKAEQSTCSILPFDSSAMSFDNSQNWRSMSIHSLQEKPAQCPFENDVSATLRRKSCPAPNMPCFGNSSPTDQKSMESQGWYNNMLPFQDQVIDGEKKTFNNLNSIKRHASYDSQTSNINHPNSPDYYMPQDIKMIYAQKQKHQQQQSTPPLTASCSGSTVSGSPISLDNLYTDSNASSSPLGSQQMW